MVTSAQIGLSIVTVILSALLSWIVSRSVAIRKLRMEYEWKKYHDAEEWCDDFIMLLRELQASYRIKLITMTAEDPDLQSTIPGKDLDDYSTRIIEQTTNQPPVIYDLLAERDNDKKDIPNAAGAITPYCRALSDENLQNMGDSAPEKMGELEGRVCDLCDELVDEIMKFRNEELQNNYKN